MFAAMGMKVGTVTTADSAVIDDAGRAVSMIQSIYFEFGSGVVLPETGIWWQNRGCSFDLRPGRLRSLEPGRKPFHTLNPAMARLDDGRLLVYGTMGGEGQGSGRVEEVAAQGGHAAAGDGRYREDRRPGQGRRP